MITAVKLAATNKVGFVDDAPDLAPLGPRPIKQLQNNSPEAMRGDPAYVPGAEGGDFLVPRGEEIALYKGTTGLEVIFVSFEEYFLEWPAVRGAGGGGPLDRHVAMPSDANWVLDQATGRRVCLRANGNKIEKTVYGHVLIDGTPGTFVFRSTAYPIGRSHASLTSLLKVKIDDQEIRVVGAKWRVTSRLESNDLGRWFVPQIELIGKFGSPGGPTLAEVRIAKSLRIAMKTGGEPPALAAHKTASPAEVARGQTTSTTGPQPPPAPPREEAPPPISADEYDGFEVDDDIPF
jgi:hypothetical protein